jgi:hypothetical protein
VGLGGVLAVLNGSADQGLPALPAFRSLDIEFFQRVKPFSLDGLCMG